MPLEPAPPGSLTIEITEGLLVSDAQQVMRCLDALHRAGARISIDDFGTGFSSLADLKDFGVDYLKIDKSVHQQPDGKRQRQGAHGGH
ncbi:MAG: EAL domain-containing protein [Telluria sp.]